MNKKQIRRQNRLTNNISWGTFSSTTWSGRNFGVLGPENSDSSSKTTYIVLFPGLNSYIQVKIQWLVYSDFFLNQTMGLFNRFAHSAGRSCWVDRCWRHDVEPYFYPMNESNRRIASINRIDELNQRIAFQNDPKRPVDSLMGRQDRSKRAQELQDPKLLSR